MHCASISCHWFGHVFWSGGILSQNERNSRIEEEDYHKWPLTDL